MTETGFTLHAPSALLPCGWAEHVAIDVDKDGWITGVEVNARSDLSSMTGVAGAIVPGIPNLHSHAHQRAMAGMSEYRASEGEERDSFWTWRKVMHAFAPKVSPEALEIIATQLYIEMLQAGYTSVCEFHYMHHDSNGLPYENPSEMSEAIVRAARQAGIALTLLPVLYSRGGYGETTPNDGQRRFICSPDLFCEMFDSLEATMGNDGDIVIGVAPHSPRQVERRALERVLDHLRSLSKPVPVHIHVAEQINDVEESLAHDLMRPVEWTLENFEVNENWCLVHATHMSESEVRAVAASAAVVGICPTTEANLGDGLFPLNDFLAAGGSFGVGSDSNVSVSPVEELRWLEYVQRLTRQERNTVVWEKGGSTGRRLFEHAVHGGAQAAGRKTGRIAEGYRADFIAIDTESPWNAGKAKDRLIDSFLFAGNANAVNDVWVGGNRVVSEGRHASSEVARDRFIRLIQSLEL